MDENDQKERLSLAYINAVAAHAGYQVVETKIDKGSIDGQFSSDDGFCPRIDFQAKATSLDIIRGDNIHFPLTVKNYDDLRANVMLPRLLIVVLLPSSAEDWLAHSEDELRVRRCGYWLSLAGQPQKPNVRSVTVSIPRSQVLDTAQLRALMGRMERREPL